MISWISQHPVSSAEPTLSLMGNSFPCLWFFSPAEETAAVFFFPVKESGKQSRCLNKSAFSVSPLQVMGKGGRHGRTETPDEKWEIALGIVGPSGGERSDAGLLAAS